MKITGNTILIFLATTTPVPIIGAVSFVYNLKIAQTNKQKIIQELTKKYNTVAAATVIGQLRKNYTDFFESVYGVLGSLRYVPEHFYCTVDFAFGKIQRKNSLLPNSPVQLDDLLFTAGYMYMINDICSITISGLFGIPLHKDDTLEHLQFGYGHLGFGGQVDTNIRLTNDQSHALLGAMRCIYFARRKTSFKDTLHDFSPGTVADIFFAYAYSKKRLAWELGYDLTVLFSPSIQPIVQLVLQISRGMRNSFYIAGTYAFFIEKYPSAFKWGISYGFDSPNKLYGFKSVVTIWGSWGLRF